MQLQEFWDRIGMCPQGRSAAEAAEREIAEPRTDPAAVRAACEMLFDAGTGEEGFKALQNALGEDADGMKTLACLARCAAAVHGAYARRGIADDIYAATMRFLSRFTAENLQKYGRPRLLNGWWFWRQLSMREFRLGALEYEMTHDETGRRCLSLHIPSDARLTQAELAASMQRVFLRNFTRPMRRRRCCALRGCSPLRSPRCCRRGRASCTFRAISKSCGTTRTPTPPSNGSSPIKTRLSPTCPKQRRCKKR